jgi:hypothetical protein
MIVPSTRKRCDLLRARKRRIDTTVVDADIDHPIDARLREHGDSSSR